MIDNNFNSIYYIVSYRTNIFGMRKEVEQQCAAAKVRRDVTAAMT